LAFLDSQLAEIASVVISILNIAKIPFSGRDLSNVAIPKA